MKLKRIVAGLATMSALGMGVFFSLQQEAKASSWNHETPAALRGKWETKPYKIGIEYDDGRKGWGQTAYIYHITKHYIAGSQLQTDYIPGKVIKTNSSGRYYHIHSYSSIGGGYHMKNKIKRLSKNKILIQTGNRNRAFYRVRHFHNIAKALS
ncbi:hypothetical protein [Lentilactobacillus hilgardii]|uniref:hypothetical protein n=1 Tax=Lentilactobacillus hilgardii TaxID=1588 RepID=UPI0021C264F2|nr:hypothetical protein [Lentilactobacillus hilgardii]MCP9333911.1 hypothetical protein [Lentilactobacillus hilgardii]MCP9350510.1 hypothetical protein [Lentilactobacillus hilgardii]MCP9353406.1 hypothetical protein [Lentilactobacillus hilgardii]